jgi:hypothetical protein
MANSNMTFYDTYWDFNTVTKKTIQNNSFSILIFQQKRLQRVNYVLLAGKIYEFITLL